ncbi:hypothetical protein EEB13_05590 [Rhodococcus sp. WS3]|uniref:DUF7620 family protein n=1 Tax=Rhodococcus sp. WS3 TaxID=2486271 RepID=UPI001142AFB8|nr:hypothetical protein [Rhodococcus sp. WS3]ROZ49396.1 hypothetical protein EEB13_05590 [Rhodococcus sp. WS3]
MRWPWSKALDAARNEVKEAAELHAYSTQERMNTEVVAAEAMASAERQKEEFETNGWTRLLQESMGGSQ